MTFSDETVRRAVPLPGGIKQRLRDQRAIHALWTSYRERQVLGAVTTISSHV